MIDIKEELESLMPVLQGSTQGAAVAFCIRILGERWEAVQLLQRSLAALRALYDEQNEPPLIRRESEWRAAMALALDVLQEEEHRKGAEGAEEGGCR